MEQYSDFGMKIHTLLVELISVVKGIVDSGTKIK